MPTVHGFMNVYRSGWFHREGKPGCTNRHAGDLYCSYESALRDIEPSSHYIATVPVSWEDPEEVKENPAQSVPVPLGVSRKRYLEEHG